MFSHSYLFLSYTLPDPIPKPTPTKKQGKPKLCNALKESAWQDIKIKLILSETF